MMARGGGQAQPPIAMLQGQRQRPRPAALGLQQMSRRPIWPRICGGRDRGGNVVLLQRVGQQVFHGATPSAAACGVDRALALRQRLVQADVRSLARTAGWSPGTAGG